MSACALKHADNLPVLRLTMIGRGEDALRMEKRLRCAGRAVGAQVEIEWQAENYGQPVVYFDDKILTDHLLDTVEIEQILHPLLKHREKETDTK